MPDARGRILRGGPSPREPSIDGGIAPQQSEGSGGLVVTIGLLLLPWCLPGVVTARVFEWMYHPAAGLANLTLGLAGAAPRNWLGDNGQAGAVTVGPYVRVNLIDCRDFTHTVTIAGQTMTTLVQANGTWNATPTLFGAGTWTVGASAPDPAGNFGSSESKLHALRIIACSGCEYPADGNTGPESSIR